MAVVVAVVWGTGFFWTKTGASLKDILLLCGPVRVQLGMSNESTFLSYLVLFLSVVFSIFEASLGPNTMASC